MKTKSLFLSKGYSSQFSDRLEAGSYGPKIPVGNYWLGQTGPGKINKRRFLCQSQDTIPRFYADSAKLGQVLLPAARSRKIKKKTGLTFPGIAVSRVSLGNPSNPALPGGIPPIDRLFPLLTLVHRRGGFA